MKSPYLFLLIAMTSLAQAAPAHVHGQARLDVAIDGTQLSLHLDSPLDSLLGYEHAPRNAREAQTARQMADTLRAFPKLFVTPAAAGCQPGKVALESAALGQDLLAGGKSAAKFTPAKTEGHTGHADLDGDFSFQCAHPAALHSLDVQLFQAFPKLQRLDVQLVGPNGQSGNRLTPANHDLSW